jgi:hypothetical protein
MSFVIAAMRNTSFLCAAMVVAAVIAIGTDIESDAIAWHLGDIADLMLVPLGAMYQRVAEDSEFRALIKGMLFGVGFLLVLMHTVGHGR